MTRPALQKAAPAPKVKAMPRPARLAAVALASLAAPAAAGEVFAGLSAHGLKVFDAIPSQERGVDVVAGIRSGPVARLAGATLRLHLLGSANTHGGLGFVAAGAGLRWDIGSRLYLQPGLGIAIHTGNGQHFQATPDELYLGSRVVFEPELVAGARLSSRWAAEIAYVHLSHARIFSRQNPGLDTLGVRLSYRFGR